MGMVLGESFQVAAVIKKLPPAWKDTKNYPKHKRKEKSMEDLVVRLHIEEDNRGSNKKGAHTSTEVKANFVELGQGSKTKGRAISWDLKKRSPRRKSSKGNA